MRYIDKIIKGEEAEHQQMKKCANCGRILPLSAFKKHNKGTYGRVAVCNECKGGSIKPQGKEKKEPEKKEIAKEEDDHAGVVRENLTDSELILELRRRGWTGRLQKTIEITLTDKA